MNIKLDQALGVYYLRACIECYGAESFAEHATYLISFLFVAFV